MYKKMFSLLILAVFVASVFAGCAPAADTHNCYGSRKSNCCN
jgi:hypothetical protein